MRIGFLDQFDLPRTRPFLEPLFALDSKFDLIELFEVHEPMHAVSSAESVDGVGPVLVNAADKIVGYADVERAPTSLARM
jgi:hypothetical protein